MVSEFVLGLVPLRLYLRSEQVFSFLLKWLDCEGGGATGQNAMEQRDSASNR